LLEINAAFTFTSSSFSNSGYDASMKHFLIVVVALFFTACNFQPSGYTANDIVLYGIKERHTIFYGKLEPGQTKELTLGPVKITLSPQQPQGALAVPGALSANGQPTLRTNTASLREIFALATIPLSSDLSVLTRGAVERVIYYDGTRWFDAGNGPFPEAAKLRLPVRERSGLRGVGLLTDAEADALAAYLTNAYKRQPLGLALIKNGNHPDTPLGLNPRPDRNNITALYVQTGVPADLLGGFAPTESLRLEPLLTGSNASYGDAAPAVRLDKDTVSFQTTWNLMTGNQVPAPPLPNVDFSTSSVVTFFLGQKATGGYGVAVAGAIQEGTTLSLRLNLREPAPGAITTQAFSSPFVSIRVTGGGRIDRVTAVNAATGARLATSP
jgi:PrcB C-terminal